MFNLNLILGGAILITSTAGSLLQSRCSASCRRVLLLVTTSVVVAALALLSTSLAFRCPARHILHFSGTSDDEEEFGYNWTTTTTTPPPTSTTPAESSTCQDSDFPNELLLLAAVLASQHLGMNVSKGIITLSQN